MLVHGPNANVLAVDEELVAFDLRGPETNLPRDHLDDFVVRVLERDQQAVEIRLLW